MARPFLTILLLQRDELVRAEFARGPAPRLTGLQRARRDVHGGLTELIESEGLPGGTLSGNVWILSDEIHTQTLDLDARNVRGLDDAQTAAALGYEAQTLSGLSALDGALGWRALPSHEGKRSFWVAQLAASERDQWAEALRRGGARFLGCAHPAGLPRRLGSATRSDGSWKRIESWHELAAEVESLPEGGVSIELRRADSARWRRDALGTTPPSEALLAHGGAQIPVAAEAQAFDLADDAALGTWLAAWAHTLVEDPDELPVIRAAARPTPLRTLITVAAGLLVLAAAACAWHYRSTEARRAALATELARINAPAERVARARGERVALESKLASLRETALGARVISQPCTWSRDLPRRWMLALAESRPSGMTIDSFDIGWRRSSVRGMCVEPHLVDQFVASLARSIADTGCRVGPTLKRLRQEPELAPLYEFEVQIAAPSVIASVSAEQGQ